jgi:hypothetical protein
MTSYKTRTKQQTQTTQCKHQNEAQIVKGKQNNANKNYTKNYH